MSDRGFIEDAWRQERVATEEALMRFVGFGVDVAATRTVVRDGGALEVRLTFIPLFPGDVPPPSCTIYHLSAMGIAGHA